MRLEPGYPISNSAPGRRGKLSCFALAPKGADKNAPTAKSSSAQDFMFMNCLSDGTPQCCGKIISAEAAGQATKYGSALLGLKSWFDSCKKLSHGTTCTSVHKEHSLCIPACRRKPTKVRAAQSCRPDYGSACYIQRYCCSTARVPARGSGSRN